MAGDTGLDEVTFDLSCSAMVAGLGSPFLHDAVRPFSQVWLVRLRDHGVAPSMWLRIGKCTRTITTRNVVEEMKSAKV